MKGRVVSRVVSRVGPSRETDHVGREKCPANPKSLSFFIFSQNHPPGWGCDDKSSLWPSKKEHPTLKC